MKRFPLLISLASAAVWLLPVVGPFAASDRALAITSGNVNPGGYAESNFLLVTDPSGNREVTE